MAARPPHLAGRSRALDRIVRAVFPRSVDRARPRGNDHVARCGAAGAAHRVDQIEIITPAKQLGTLGRKRLGDPVVRIMPRGVGGLHGTGGCQAIICQRHALAIVEEQVAAAILADDMARIDQAADLEVDRITPRPSHRRRMDHEDIGEARQRRGPRRLHERDVDEIAPVMSGNIDRKHSAQRLLQGRAKRTPVHQIARMPDQQPRRGIERGMRHVVVVAVLQDGRIGIIAREHRIEIGAIAAIRDPLPFQTAPPERLGSRGAGGTSCSRSGGRLPSRRCPGAEDRTGGCQLQGRSTRFHMHTPNWNTNSIMGIATKASGSRGV